MAKYLTIPSWMPDQEPMRLWCKRGKYIVVPRAIAPLAGVDKRVEGENYMLPSHFEPRNEEQHRVCHASVALLRQGISHILKAKTGFGKTIIGVAIALALGKKTLIAVTKNDIADQWLESIEKLSPGASVGWIQGNNVDIDHPFVIGTIQSLCKVDRYPKEIFQQFGLWEIDEVHRMGADKFSMSAWNVPAKLRLGLSATPKRTDGRTLVFYSHIGPVLVEAKQKSLDFFVYRVASGWYCPRKKVWNPDAGWEMQRIPHKKGKTMHLNKMLAGTKTRNEIICRFIQATRKKERTVIVFSETLAHLDTLMKMCFEDYGISEYSMAKYVGGLSKTARAEALEKPVLFATYKYCSEGTDIPWADTLVLGMPRSNVEQIVGRILREHEDKKRPVVLDILDNDSPVFADYADTRKKWYRKEGATVRKAPRKLFLGEDDG
jgi:superfamily II DNA or RNA helicase